MPIILSFLVYSVMNFPANHFIDTKGLRFSFLVGSGFFMAGAAMYTLINKSYIFMIFGYILMSTGQPFIINCPAKIATYWFFDNNVTIYIFLETIRNFFNDWIHAYWNWLRIRITNFSCTLKIICIGCKKWDILSLRRIILSFCYCFHISLHVHEKITTYCSFNWCRTAKIRPKIIF